MKKFEGFHEGKVRLTSLPESFYTELLPHIDHLGELKVSLYIFWRLDQKEGVFRYLQVDDILADKRFMRGLGAKQQEARANLEQALERAVNRGTLLRATILREGSNLESNLIVYFLNSPKGRAAVQAIENGEWRLTGDPQRPIDVEEMPNIYQLYEEHIGPLTPMIADSLRDAEATFPPQWIEDAIQIAVENNVRNWRYVIAILERWQVEGRDERKDRRDTKKARRRYVEGEYADYIEH